jgi:hypothetical protein
MSTKRAIQYWVIPPEADAEFVAHMEDVLDVYCRAYDANIPVLCMDEQPVQLVEEVKTPTSSSPARSRVIRNWQTKTFMQTTFLKLILVHSPCSASRQTSAVATPCAARSKTETERASGSSPQQTSCPQRPFCSNRSGTT